MPLPPDFDAGAAAAGEGLFGLPTRVEGSRVVVVPVPFEATVSYGAGTVFAPAAVLRASWQIDLHDADTGRPYESGIAMLPEVAEIADWSAEARGLALPVIKAGGAGENELLQQRARSVDAICERMNTWVRERVAALFDAGQLPFVLGGDHSVALGGLQAVAERHPGVGVLHVDAHYDLRLAFEGLRYSHASVMRNALDTLPGIGRVVHVGVRDFSEDEREYAEECERSTSFFDAELRDRSHAGEPWADVVADIVAALPEVVHVSFDIDGLDPTLCPGTGTPVPGGLSWHQAVALLLAVARSGRRIVSGDLVEVAPVPGDREWNANVGARLLYKLIGCALMSAG